MNSTRFYFALLFGTVLALAAAQTQFAYCAAAQDNRLSASSDQGPARNPDRQPSGASEATGDQGPDTSAIIAPYRSAEIAAEARGVIEAIHFKEGDSVPKGQVVILISKKRYELAERRAVNTVKAAEIDLKRAHEEVQLKEQLLSNKATTSTEALKAKGDQEIAQYRLEEAKIALELARLDLESCEVKAPFSGRIAVSYKEPFESVDYSQRLFVIVDKSKVYAIASVAETDLSDFAIGRRATFVTPIRKKQSFVGTVERVGALLDSRSGAKKVYVVIDNSSGQLEIGMTGSLEPAK
jgi:membrane fusion protein, multidrug efflux system